MSEQRKPCPVHKPAPCSDSCPNNPERADCIACSSPSVARVVDGVFRKPVCATHQRLYADRGYLIYEARP